jgi:hypothetical protein
VERKMPAITPQGGGTTRHQGVQAYRYHEGVPKQMPMVGANGAGPDSSRSGVLRIGYDTPGALLDYFARLSDRLRRVRFLCGDWQRAVKESVTVNHGVTSCFLDPPYPAAEHDMAYHAEHGGDVWYEAAQWAVDHGDDHRLRICIAGYDSPATDALFPASWARERWQARGGYANQKADGRGRANAKRETLWFSKYCLQPGIEAKTAFERPIVVRESSYEGTMFEENEEQS